MIRKVLLLLALALTFPRLDAQRYYGPYRAAVIDIKLACSPIPEAYPWNQLVWVDSTTMNNESTKGLVYEWGPANIDLVAATSGALLGIRTVRPDQYELLSLRFRETPEVLATFDLPGLPTRGVADGAGNFYVLSSGHTATSNSYITSVSRSGLRGAPALLPNGFEYAGFDLAADQCTFYLSRWNATTSDILVYNFCTKTVAGTINVLSGTDIKVLPGGDLLVSTGARYTPSGTHVRTYVLPGGRADTLALARNGRSFIAAYGCLADEPDDIDLQSGEVITKFPFQYEGIRSLVVFDGWTAAVGPFAIADIPTLSTYALITLAIFTAAVALLRVRP